MWPILAIVSSKCCIHHKSNCWHRQLDKLDKKVVSDPYPGILVGSGSAYFIQILVWRCRSGSEITKKSAHGQFCPPLILLGGNSAGFDRQEKT